MRRLALCALALTLPLSALAETTPPAPKPARDDPNKVICRRETVTGTLAQTRKVCMTRADWAARSRGAREAAEQMQQNGLVNSCGASEPGRC